MQRQITDSTKVIAAIAVVGIHATSTAESNFFLRHDFFSLDFFGVLVNQCARFSVPLFIYLSAYGLAKSEKKSDTTFISTYFHFLWKRLPTILVPYFFFSGIALALEFHSHRGITAELAVLVVNKLRIGAADYHLYFLVILAQCYLLFPLLARIARAFPGGYRTATWLALFLVAGLLYKGSSEWLLPKLGLTHPGWHASFVIYWLPYFMLGILHAHQPPFSKISVVKENSNTPVTNNPQLWKSISIAGGVAITLAYVVGEYTYYSRQGSPVDYYNHFSRPSVMLYALAVVYLLHSLPHPPVPPVHNVERGVEARSKPALRHRLAPLSTLWRRLRLCFQRGAGGEVARLAPLTFSVYLIHPQILRVLANYAAGLPSVFTWLIAVAVTFPIVYGLTLLTNKATQKSPVWLTGPVQFLQRCLGLR